MEIFLPNIYEYASSPQKLRYVSSSWNTGLLEEEQSIIDSLHRKYPGISCLYDIMILVAHNNDIDTLRSLLILYRGYLPINWNRYSYHVKSVEMLRLLLPHLDDDYTREIVENRIYIRTHNDIPKSELKKYLYAILLDKRYDILDKHEDKDWVPYVSSIKYQILKESREWLIKRAGNTLGDWISPLYQNITRDNLDDTLRSLNSLGIDQHREAKIIDTLMDLLKQYPTDKDVVYPILGFSLTRGYIEILDCYLTKANYIPSLALSVISDYLGDDTGIFLIRNGFSKSMDYLSNLPMSILSKLLATLIAKNNLYLYGYVVSKNKGNVSILKDKINRYIDTYPEDRDRYRL